MSHSHRLVATLSGGHSRAISTLALCDTTLASGSDEDSCLCLWSPLHSRSPTHVLTTDHPCTCIKFSQQKPDLIYVSQGCHLTTFDTRNFTQPVNDLQVSEDEINSIDLLESESRLATGDDTGCIKIITTDTMQVVRSLKKHDNICSCVKFRPNRTWQLVSGGLDSRLMVSDWKETGRGVTIFEMSELLDFPEEEGHNEAEEDEQDEEEDDEEEEEDEEEEIEFEDEAEEQHPSHRVSFSSNLSSSSSRRVSRVSRGLINIEENSGSHEEDGNDDEEDEAETEELSRQARSRGSSAEEEPDDTVIMNHSSSGWRHHVRIHASQAEGHGFLASAMSTGYAVVATDNMPVNPPMIYSLAASRSGHLIAVGLASNSVELFIGTAKHLLHSESLYGHSRGVSALQMVQNDQFLVSGGNDKNIFVWPLASENAVRDSVSGGSQMQHTQKIEALAGDELCRVFVADSRPIINLMDLSLW